MNRSQTNSSIRLIASVISIALVAVSRAASPASSVENPATTSSPGERKLSLKEPVPVESLGASVATRWSGFEVVPGKDPNGWSFIVEPYLWGLGIDGTVGVKRFDSHVDFNPLTVVKHLDWGIMAEAEVRKGKWGILGDGFFAQLSASGDPPGPLYRNANIKLQQGMVELALAYRIIDDRRGFVDIYAGARYNYFGVSIEASMDKDGVSTLTDQMTNRLAAGIDATVSRIVTSNPALLESDIETLAQGELTARTLEDFADTPKDIRDVVRADKLRRVFNSRTGAFANYIAAEAAVQLAAARGELTSDLQSQADAARKKLARQLSEDIEDALPTSASGDRWWVDPVIGLRTQINFTRWLFLALQGDVGGFGAGSQIAWFASGSIGVNLTRNVFLEAGYRYFFMDYENDGFTYDAAQSGLFMGIGLKL